MADRKISNFEITTLNYFLTRAFLIGFTFNSLLCIVKQDSWIIPIISIIPALFIIIIINTIFNYKPNLEFPNKIISLYGKKNGYFMSFIITLIVFFISILNYLNLNNFIQSQFLNRTPFLAISIMFMITTYYILNKGLNTITRTSNILFYIGFILLILSFLGLLPTIKLDNLKPFFDYNTKKYMIGLNSFYSLNILPMLLITIIPKNKIVNPNIKKYLTISYIVSAISIFFIMFQTIATFGYKLSILYEYPEFFALKHVILAKLSSRVESILIIQLILDVFIFNLFSIYFISKSINAITKSKNSNIVYIFICTFIVIGTNYISKYNMYLSTLIKSFIPIVISIIVTSIFIIIFIKIKISKN